MRGEELVQLIVPVIFMNAADKPVHRSRKIIEHIFFPRLRGDGFRYINAGCFTTLLQFQFVFIHQFIKAAGAPVGFTGIESYNEFGQYKRQLCSSTRNNQVLYILCDGPFNGRLMKKYFARDFCTKSSELI